MDFLLITTLVVALVELVKRIEQKDYRTVIIILGAGLIGAIIGYLHLHGISVEDGVLAGFSASGFVTVASRIGGMK
jgi:hypothetical protein